MTNRSFFTARIALAAALVIAPASMGAQQKPGTAPMVPASGSGPQFKVPLGRQEMTTSSGLQFVERSFLSYEFTRGRDIGIQVSGRVAKNKLEYHAGMFNGNPASRLENDNTRFQYNARLSFQPFGPVRYRESDFETRDKPLLAIDAEFESNDLHGATNANDLDTTTL